MIENEKIKTIIHRTLSLIFIENKRADFALHEIFSSQEPLSFEERGICANTVYGVVRYWRLLKYMIDSESPLDRDSFENLLRAFALLDGEEAVGTPFDEKTIHRMKAVHANRAIRESIPVWLDKYGERELGAGWDTIIASLNIPARLVIRVNTLKTDKETLKARLESKGITAQSCALSPDALVLPRNTDIASLPDFHDGLFEVQDVVSQFVSVMIAPEPRMRVIDGCAGNGGKALHMAALMKNKGKIIALDVDGRKLETLRKRAVKAGATIIETRLISSTKTIKRLEGQADVLLLDVPCSGSGVLRRNPDSKWRLSEDDIMRLLKEQSYILAYYSRMVKPGGLLGYSCCSVFPSEGEQQINDFLTKNKNDFRMIGEKRIDPHIDGYDGFYIAKLKKNNESDARLSG